MAGADEAADADAGTSVIGQVKVDIKRFDQLIIDNFTNSGLIQVQTVGLDVAAGVAVEEVGQLRVADQAADTVGIAVVLAVFIASHDAGDIDGSEAVTECQLDQILVQIPVGGTVGLGVADQSADGALAADAIPVLVCVNVVITMGHVSTVEVGVLGIQIDTAVDDPGVIACRTDQSAGGGVALHILVFVTEDGVLGDQAVPLDAPDRHHSGGVHEGVTLDDGVDHVEVGNIGIDIAEQAGELVVHHLTDAGCIVGAVQLQLDAILILTLLAHVGNGILGGVNVQIVYPVVVAGDLGVALGDGLVGALRRQGFQLIGQGRNSGIALEDSSDLGVRAKNVSDKVADEVPNAAAVFAVGILEGSGTEQVLIVDGNEVGQTTAGVLCAVVVIGAAHAILIIIVVNGLVPVDVAGECHAGDPVCHGGRNGIQVLQVTAVGNAQGEVTRIVGIQLVEHGIEDQECIIDIDFNADLFGVEIDLRLDQDVIAGQDRKLGLIQVVGQMLVAVGNLSAVGFHACGCHVGKAGFILQGVHGEIEHDGLAVHVDLTLGNIHHEGADGAAVEFAVHGQLNGQTIHKLIQVGVVGLGNGDLDGQHAFLALIIEDHVGLGAFQIQLGAGQAAAVVVAEHQLLTLFLVTGQSAFPVLAEDLVAAVENCEDVTRLGVVLNDDVALADNALHAVNGQNGVKGAAGVFARLREFGAGKHIFVAPFRCRETAVTLGHFLGITARLKLEQAAVASHF